MFVESKDKQTNILPDLAFIRSYLVVVSCDEKKKSLQSKLFPLYNITKVVKLIRMYEILFGGLYRLLFEYKNYTTFSF